MKRTVVAGTGLGLLAALGACAGGVLPTGAGPADQDGGVRVPGAGEHDSSPDPTAARSGPLPDGRAISCVESYSPQALAGRAFAFDGVVVNVGPSVTDRGGDGDLGLPGVTFEVREWFTGGGADTVTVDVQAPFAGSAEASDPAYAYGIGSRLLVSGEARWGGSPLEEPIAWACGFTRYHDRDTAADWRDALTR